MTAIAIGWTGVIVSTNHFAQTKSIFHSNWTWDLFIRCHVYGTQHCIHSLILYRAEKRSCLFSLYIPKLLLRRTERLILAMDPTRMAAVYENTHGCSHYSFRWGWCVDCVRTRFLRMSFAHSIQCAWTAFGWCCPSASRRNFDSLRLPFAFSLSNVSAHTTRPFHIAASSNRLRVSDVRDRHTHTNARVVHARVRACITHKCNFCLQNI